MASSIVIGFLAAGILISSSISYSQVSDEKTEPNDDTHDKPASKKSIRKTNNRNLKTERDPYLDSIKTSDENLGLYELTSKEHREEKRAELSIYSRIQQYGNPSSHKASMYHVDTGLTFSLFASQNFKYGISIGQSKSTLSYDTLILVPKPFGGTSNEYDDIKLRGTGLTISPMVQYWFGNSFQLKGSIRSSKGTYKSYSYRPQTFARPRVSSDVDLQYSHSSIDLYLGNQWNWDTFTWGIDYLSYGKTFTYSVEGRTLSDTRKKELDVSFISLGIYFGATF
ncbi:MAG: hypothetical protein EOP48_00145 [Sphingobacteriales bacterium]|nr:MAG: hypothetical protein EOP48_00145 [Sphingobacteriales bacterium]